MRRLIILLFSIVCLVIIISMTRSIITLWKRGNVVNDQQKQLAKKQQENEDLKKKLAEVESPEFIEKQARDKLNLQKEGEVVVILPKFDNSKPDQQEIIQTIPNWKKWWKLIIQ